jgi:dihydrolipoamide dehydrogenase
MSMAYDLVIIGGGPAGYHAAEKAASAGLKTALVEEDLLGGTCLNRGCIPTKALLHGTAGYAAFRKENDIYEGNLSLNVKGLYTRKDNVVDTLRKGIESLLKAGKVDILSGHAVIQDAHTVQVNDETISCENILVCTGSRPARLPIPGIEHAVNSDAFFAGLPEHLDSLVIIGGGVIGVEIASIFSAMGTEVTILEALPNLLANMDKDIGRNLAQILKKKGVKVITGAAVKEITKQEKTVCHYELKGKEQEASGDMVLVSVGRRANTEGLFADESLVETNRGIVTDDAGRTSCEGIYAAGDVVSRSIMLAHAAGAQAENAVAAILKQQPQKNAKLIPACVYTDPEIAVVGMTEEQAKEQGYKAVKAAMHANPRCLIQDAERSFMKIVFDDETKKVLGAHLMCDRASDMIMEFVTAINQGMTVEEMFNAVRPHPSFTEAADDVFRKALA